MIQQTISNQGGHTRWYLDFQRFGKGVGYLCWVNSAVVLCLPLFPIMGVSCLAQSTELTELAVEIRTIAPIPKLRAEYKLVGIGKVTKTNGFRTTTETYYGRKCAKGYFIASSTNWASCFRTSPNVSEDRTFASFEGEKLFKVARDSPFQYSKTVHLMTNTLQNGFLSADRQAAEIFALATGLGIGDYFVEGGGLDTTSGNGVQNLPIHLRSLPEVICNGRLVVSNNIPSRLDIIFTNKLNEIMGYHYVYSAEGRIPWKEPPFGSIHLVVSNHSQGTFRFDRFVKLLNVQKGYQLVSRADFGFAAKLPPDKLWRWDGDEIEGIDKKLAALASAGTVSPSGKRTMFVRRIVFFILAVIPLFLWLYWRKAKQQNINELSIK